MTVDRMRVDARYAMGFATAPRSVAGGFALPLTAGAQAAAVPDALEERGGRRSPERAARRHADALLAALMAVQRGMLDGDEVAAVAALDALASQPTPPAEPPLAALLAEIRLRARVTAVQCRERWRATPWRASSTSL